MSFTTAAVLVAWVAIALLAFVVSHLLRQVSLLADRGGNGRRMAPTALTPPQQVLQQIGDPQRRFALVLVVGESCGTCHRLLPRYVELARTHSNRDVSFSVATLGDGQGLGELSGDVGVLSHARLWTEPLGIHITPHLLVIDRTRNEATGNPVGSMEALEGAVSSALTMEEIAG